MPNLASPIESTSAASFAINEDSPLNILETNSSIFESNKTQRNQSDGRKVFLECSHHISNNMDRSWLNTVQDIETDSDGSITSQCILGVTQVLRVSRRVIEALLIWWHCRKVVLSCLHFFETRTPYTHPTNRPVPTFPATSHMHWVLFCVLLICLSCL